MVFWVKMSTSKEVKYSVGKSMDLSLLYMHLALGKSAHGGAEDVPHVQVAALGLICSVILRWRHCLLPAVILPAQRSRPEGSHVPPGSVRDRPRSPECGSGEGDRFSQRMPLKPNIYKMPLFHLKISSIFSPWVWIIHAFRLFNPKIINTGM